MGSTVAESDNETGHSRLLSLPPELRNAIYRYALGEGHIYIDGSNAVGFQQPALLQVSKQIYYSEHEFRWYITSFNAEALVKWQISSDDRSWARQKISLEGPLSWPNLLLWLKEFHHGNTGGPGHSADAQPYVQTATCMFQVVSKLGALGHRLQWEDIKSILEEMRQAAGAYEEAWIKEE